MITLTPKQAEIVEAILNFFESDKQIFILRGYVGTGKTTILDTLIKKIRDHYQYRRPWKVMAPTGRAAKVLREKTDEGETIHHCIYTCPNQKIEYAKKGVKEQEVDQNDPTGKLTFLLDSGKFKRLSPILLIDEASMISSKTNHQPNLQFGSDNLLEDILEYADIKHGGQILFIGDDAQLPPVGDTFSAALSDGYFRDKGLSVESAELTEVIRQGKENPALINSIAVRSLLKLPKGKRMGFNFLQNEELFREIPFSNLIDSYLQYPLKGTMLIAFANRTVSDLNKAIRSRIFPGHEEPTINDKLIIVRNQYQIPVRYQNITKSMDVFNGEFCAIREIGQREIHEVPVGKKKITLRFLNVKLTHESGAVLSVKILENLLDSPEAELSLDEQKALFVDVMIRHPGIQVKSRQFELSATILRDPYFNALQVKYGYAITGHKSQGGEWKRIFIDFRNRSGLDDDTLRWTYTVITRTSEFLYFCNHSVQTPLLKLDFQNIVHISKIDKEGIPLGNTIPKETPFHDQDSFPCKRAKYASVQRILLPNEKITRVDSRDYQESYFIDVDGKEIRLDAYHDKNGKFKPFKLVTGEKDPNVTDLVGRLNQEERPIIQSVDYHPSSQAFSMLYQQMLSSIKVTTDVQLINVVEQLENHYVTYYLYTDCCSYIRFYFNEKGFITSAAPGSEKGGQDALLKQLIASIEGSVE